MSDIRPSSTASQAAADTGARRLQKFPRISFGVLVLLGLLAGVCLGFLALHMGQTTGTNGQPIDNWLTATLDWVGSTFVTLLKTLIPPLIFLAIISSIAKLRGVTNAAALAWKTIMWFAITALIAVLVGIGVGLVMHPGVGTQLSSSAAHAPSRQGGWFDFLKSLIPGNFLGMGVSVRDNSASLSFNALQILVIAIVVGLAAVKVGRKAEPFLSCVDSLLSIVQKILGWVIRLVPIGTAGLIGHAVATLGWTTLGDLASFVLAIIVGVLLVGFVVYPIIIKVHGLSIRHFISGIWPAVALAFASRSSMGTMPVTRAVTTENLGVPKEYASFAVPLGATTKMDGCASIYPAIAAIFIANFYGIHLDFMQYVLIIIVAVIGSAATAGMTGAIVMLTLTLSTLGLPLEGVGLLMAVDPIVDMFRTALNVAGQCLVVTVVAKEENILDERIYNGPNTFENIDDDNDEDGIHQITGSQESPSSPAPASTAASPNFISLQGFDSGSTDSCCPN